MKKLTTPWKILSAIAIVSSLGSAGTAKAETSQDQNAEYNTFVATYESDCVVDKIDEIIGIVVSLEEYVTLEESAAYLRPIKVYAGKVKAMIMGHGTHSTRFISMANNLVRKIKASADFIEKRYQVNATFDLAMALEAQAEALDDLID